MSKYAPLTDFLAEQRTREVPMTFAEIEALIGTTLPASKTRREWWSNNAANNVMTRAWLAAGFRSQSVDIPAERLVFSRGGEEEASTEAGEERRRPLAGFFDRVRERLGGTVTIAPGVDITEPIDVEWDAMR